MKKILFVVLTTIFLMAAGWLAFIYYVPYSKGTRAGELIKFSNKGVVFKTWEGEISQGISGAQIFSFSVLDQEKEAIEALNEYQGQYVKLEYIERFGTFSFWGDSKYFVTKVIPEQSPHFNRQ
ncbi:6-phosphogluconate dehydrogenase [uncultured Dokdonia sp.]|uniref:6-phosphogluconate dehydrogenase n=1 Tax=uncultured Dokdonia sp. TaxID=575653 RepID=UPI0030EC0507|tara:strand:+ start:44934 stop:45302 length:369 start_codon:yes stop_codon:yes gene_type:complete